ncbi:MAG TPA: addiction module component, family protein [Desulfobacterales bacterium]|nr:addiction module component, family protein [Desulfobacterales bacterium]
MSTLTNDLFKKALDLNENDRATLAGILIESLEEKPIEEHEAVWRAEISRRVQELDSGEVETISWEDVKARLLKRYNG